MLDQSFYQKADEIIAFYGKKPASLIPIMQDIQGVYRYLPEELLRVCFFQGSCGADRCDRSESVQCCHIL